MTRLIDDSGIEINGVRYEQIPQEPRVPRKGSKLLNIMLATSMMFQITNPYMARPSRSKPLPTDDIVREFELIQLKQSKLSRSERDQVVNAFNRCYRVPSK